MYLNGGFLMYHLPDFLYEINLLSVSLRLILALLFGASSVWNEDPTGIRPDSGPISSSA